MHAPTVTHKDQRAAFDPGRRLRSDTGIPLDGLSAHFPVINSREAHVSRSDKFSVVTTYDVLSRLEDQGFHVTDFVQSKARTIERRATSRHMFRLRHVDDLGVGEGNVAEIIGVNALDGTSSFRFYGGVLRFVCFNGTVTGDLFGTSFVRHVGENTLDLVNTSVDQIAGRMPTMLDKIEQFAQIAVTPEQTKQMVDRALRVRFDEKQREAMLTSPNLATPRRRADIKSDLWTVFNRIQENTMRGGLQYSVKDKHGMVRRSSMRAIKAASDTVNVNRKLWDDVLELTAREIA